MIEWHKVSDELQERDYDEYMKDAALDSYMDELRGK